MPGGFLNIIVLLRSSQWPSSCYTFFLALTCASQRNTCSEERKALSMKITQSALLTNTTHLLHAFLAPCTFLAPWHLWSGRCTPSTAGLQLRPCVSEHTPRSVIVIETAEWRGKKIFSQLSFQINVECSQISPFMSDHRQIICPAALMPGQPGSLYGKALVQNLLNVYKNK